MARAIWKGSIAFGLVQIPVGLYSAEESDSLPLDWLDRRDLSPVGYERVNKRTGRKVAWEDIVKGYQHKKGEYVVLSDADIEQANVEASHTLEIDRFVEADAVDPMYFERPYYVAPDKNAEKAYTLLREALESTRRAAVAKYVIRTRQHIGLLVPHGNLLVLYQLRYSYELRDEKGLGLPSPKKTSITAKERQIAKSLVESMSGEWEPEAYHDEYRDDILSLIKDRVKAGEVNTVPEEQPKVRAPRPSTDVIDLVGLLKQSLEQRGGARRAAKTKKKARLRKAG